MIATLLAQAEAAADDASTYSRIGWVIAVVLIVGFLIGAFLVMRRSRSELGSEVELAANRKPYYDDDELETTRLDRVLFLGLLLLGITAVSLPLYWLYEPGRQSGAIEQWEETFVERGLEIYTEGANCQACHGPDGVGGVAETAILNDKGEFVAQVNWQAPALDTVLYRYSREEVLYILNYGRPGSPMPAWGAPGGGPLTEQQLENIVDYLFSIQLPASEASAALTEQLEAVCAPARDADGELDGDDPACTAPDAEFATYGETIFNLGLSDGFAAGAYSCGRCHTKGWSYDQPELAGGGGALGPNLRDGSELRQFPTAAAQEEFVIGGSEQGVGYGSTGQGSGKMPGYLFNPNAEGEDARMEVDQVMYTPEMVTAVVAYERGL